MLLPPLKLITQYLPGLDKLGHGPQIELGIHIDLLLGDQTRQLRNHHSISPPGLPALAFCPIPLPERHQCPDPPGLALIHKLMETQQIDAPLYIAQLSCVEKVVDEGVDLGG